MPTGLKSYYVKCRYETTSGWVSWNFVRLVEDGYKTVGSRLEATPFRTHSEAECAAFWLIAKEPDLTGLVEVELKSV